MKTTLRVDAHEMEERAKHSLLGPPVSVTLDPTPTVRLSRSAVAALLERRPRRRRDFFVFGVFVAFVGGAWAGTIKVPTVPALPRPAPVVIETVRLVPIETTVPERKLQRLTRSRARFDTKAPLFTEAR